MSWGRGSSTDNGSLAIAGRRLAFLFVLLCGVAASGAAFAQNAVNTTSVAVPSGVTDPTTTNNNATDTDPIQRQVIVNKVLVPAADAGQFVMTANGTSGTAGGNGATVTNTTAVSGNTIAFSEAASGTTSLANYTTTYSCVQTGTSTVVTSGTGTSGSFTMPSTNVTCTITNTRISATLQLQKSWGANSRTGDVASIGATTGLTPTNTTAFTATAPTAGNSGTAITVYAGQTATLPAETMTPSGALANYNTVVSCTAGVLTGTNGQTAGNTLQIRPADTGANIVCTYTNTRRSAQLTLAKTWVNALPGETTTVSTGAGFTNAASSGVATANPSGGGTTTGTAVTVFAGESGTITEVFGTPANAANYTTSIACTGTSGLSGSTLTIGAADTNVVCTVTNTRISATLQLAKSWGANSRTGDVASIGATTGLQPTNTAAFTATAPTAGNSGTAITVFAGQTATLPAETMTPAGALANYNTAVACTAGVLSGNNGQTAGNTLQIRPADSGANIVCTYTNTRKSAQLTLRKTWVNALPNETTTVSTGAGFTNAASSGLATANASGNGTTTGTAVTVFAGESGTISEVFGTPANAANYTTSIACTGTSGLSGSTLTIGAADTNVVCTVTNTRISATLQLAKSWGANSRSGDVASIGATTGLQPTNTTAFTATAPTSGNSGAAITVFAGQTATLPAETMTPSGALANYNTAVSCTAGVLSGNNGQTAGNTLQIRPADSGANIVCTYTNTRKSAQLTLAKTWSNARVNETATVSTGAGFTNPASSTLSTSTGNNTTTGTAVTVFAGETGTISEVFGTPANAANYNATIACTGTSGLSGSTLTVGPNDTTIACTLTNTRKSAQLTIAKTWVNARANETATVSTAGFGATATSGLSTANTSGGGTTTGTAVTVFAGETGTISEVFGTPANATNYNASIACTGTSGLSGSTLTIGTADTNIVCTLTNTRKSAQLTMRKTWADALVGETATFSAAGFQNTATSGISTSTGNNTTTGTAVTVFAGESATVSETFGTPANSANYNAAFACTGTSGLSGTTLTIGAADTNIVCTATNTRKNVLLTLRKTWVNAQLNNTATVTVSRGSTVIDTLVSTALVANEDDTDSSPVSVFAGEALTLAETINPGSAANYNTTLACSAGNTLAGSTLTVGSGGTPITCTYTNTRRQATLQVQKVWAPNSIAGNATTVSANFGNLASSGVSTATAAGNTTTGGAVAVFAGETGQLSETSFADQSKYTQTYACNNGVSVSPTGLISITDADAGKTIVCGITNTRKATTLQLSKAWGANSITGNVASIGATTNLINNTTAFTSTASTAASSNVVNVFAGEVATLPAETMSTGTLADYNTAVSCSGGTLGGTNGQATNTLTISEADTTPIVCTYTNTRKSAQLRLAKTWGANSIAGDQTEITAPGFTNTPTSGTSTATAAGNTTTGSFVTVFSGETATITEAAFPNQGDYTRTFTCNSGVSVSGTNAVTITPADAGKSVTCTVTNTRVTAQLTLQKIWINGVNGHTATVTASDLGTPVSTLNAVAAGGPTETDQGTPATVFAGQTLTLFETITTGSGAAYGQGLGCTGAADIDLNDGLTINPADTNVVCTFTNTRDSADLTTTKTRTSASPISSGDQVTWQIVVANQGTFDATGVTLTDLMSGGLTYVSHGAPAGTTYDSGTGIWTIGSIPTGETRTLTITATATGTPGSTVTNTTSRATGDQFDPSNSGDTLTANVVIATPSLELTKTAGAITDTDTPANGAPDAGDTITYTFKVKNTGDVAIQNVGVSDPRLPALSCTAVPSLAVNAELTLTCTNATYTLVASDLDNGTAPPEVVSNTATASGTPVGSTTPVTGTSTVNVTIPPKATTLQLRKQWINAIDTDTVSTTTVTTTGDGPQATITSSANSANETDSGTAVAISVGDEKILPSETWLSGNPDYYNKSISCTGTSGFNPATGALLVGPEDGPIICTYVNARKQTTLQLRKTWTSPIAGDVGSIGATSGNLNPTNAFTATAPATAASNVVPLFAGEAVTLPAETMSPGLLANYNVVVSCTDGTLSGADGKVSNTLTIGGDDTAAAVVCTYANNFDSQPSIELQKDGNLNLGADGVANVGDVITYTFTIRNTGNSTLSNITLTEALADVTLDPLPASIPAGQTVTVNGTYQLKQADIDAGTVVNNAIAGGTDPENTVVNGPATKTVPVPKVPGISIAKTQSGGPNPVSQVGQIIQYTVVVTNTGNVSLDTDASNEVTVTDNLAGHGPLTLIGPTESGTTDDVLSVNESWTYTTSYTVTQADLDSGATLTNAATVSVPLPVGGPLTRSDDTTTGVDQQPSISVEKTVDKPTAVFGDVLNYQITVRNTGNVPLQNVAVVDTLPDSSVQDNLPGGTNLVGPSGDTANPGVLDLGETWVFTTTYTVTAADITRGSAVNNVTANGQSPNGEAAPQATGDATTGLSANPAILVEKEADRDSISAPGVINYTVKVTNIGNTPLSNILVSDTLPRSGGSLDNDPVTGTPGFATGPNRGTFTLNPGQFVTYTTSYNVTQADLDSGQDFTNSARAEGQSPTDPVDDDSVTTANNAQPAISIDKTKISGPTTVTAAGQVIGYQLQVTNSGQVSLTGITVTDTLPDGSLATRGSGLTGPGASDIGNDNVLGVGEVWTFTVNYTVRQADLDQTPPPADLVNSATASGVSPENVTVNAAPDTVSTPVAPASSLTVVKTPVLPLTDTNGNGVIGADDTISYTFTVTNTGTTTLTGVDIDDLVVDVNVAGAPITLAPGASNSNNFTATYIIKQTDVNAGGFTNTADAVGTAPGGGTVTSPPNSATVPLTADPRLTIDKTVAGVTDVNTSGITDAGDTIAYEFLITNVGNVQLTAVGVNDNKVTSVTCPVTTLAPGAATTCTATYTVQAADETAGSVVNTANAVGTAPGGGAVTSATDSTTTLITTPAPALTFDKQASVADTNGSGLTDANDVISYTFVVTNAGNVPITGIAVNDNKVTSVTCPVTTLAPGISTTCTASYTILTADETAGSVVNIANATGTNPDGGTVTSDNDTTTTPVVAPRPELTIVKTAGTPVDVNNSGITDAGDTIAYSFTVTNTGDVPITNIAISDPLFQAPNPVKTITCAATTLAPGISTNCSIPAGSPYTVTEADETAGSVINTATVSGNDPDNQPITDTSNQTTVPVTPPAPALTIEKTAQTPVDVNQSGLVDAPDTIQYTFVVTNTGNVPIFGISVTDNLAGTVSCDAMALQPGIAMNCAAVTPYVITTTDEDNGTVDNSATAGGFDPDGGAVTSPADTTQTVIANPAPALAFVKTAGTPVDVNASGIVDAGDTIQYSFTVTNTGNVPIDSIAVNDALVGPVTCVATRLEADNPSDSDTTTCSAVNVHTISAAEVTAGAVINTATATGEDPNDATITSNPSGTNTPVVTPNPSLSIVKTAGTPVDANNSGIVDAGDTIQYTFVITNDGNVPISTIAVDDPKIGAVTCDAPTPGPRLAVGGSVNCSADAPYEITDADEAGNNVHNEATGTGVNPDGGPVRSPVATTDTPVVTPAPALTLSKTAGALNDIDGNGPDVGDTIEYTFTATNTGNVRLNTVAVTDAKLGLTAAAVTPASLNPVAPGNVGTLTAVYTVTQADVDAGEVHNIASVTGQPASGGNPVTGSDDETTPLTRTPLMTIAKTQTSGPNPATQAGQVLNYEIVAINTGNVTLNAPAVNDTLPNGDPGTLSAPVEAGGTQAGVFEVGETWTYTISYTVRQQDIDAAVPIVNSVSASASGPGGVSTPPVNDTAETPVNVTATLTLLKQAGTLTDVDGNGPDAGDTIVYTFTATNTGNVTLNPVTISDTKLDLAAQPVSPSVLAPGQQGTFTSVPYVVKQADVDAGAVNNSATASGTTPASTVITSNASTTSTMLAPNPLMTIVKEQISGQSPVQAAGEVLGYRIIATNTGNVTLAAPTVTDTLPDGTTGTLSAPLEAGGSQAGVFEVGETWTYTISYTVRQEDINAGGPIVNAVSANAAGPGGTTTPTVNDTAETPIITTTGITVDKQAGAIVDTDTPANGAGDAGDTITYTFTVRNTGNQTLSDIVVNDNKVGAVSCGTVPPAPGPTLAPNATVDCTATYALTQVDVNDGQVVNSATASGTPPTGPAITSDPDTVTTPIAPVPSLSIDKQGGPIVDTDTPANGAGDVGDTIAYTFVVTNTGNVTMTDVAVTDAKVGAVNCGTTPVTVQPGAVVTCNASYTLTQVDVNAGEFENTATAGGTPPIGPAVTSSPDTVMTPITGVPSIAIVKTGTLDLGADNRASVGDLITYAFAVTNTGNVTLTDVTVTDPLVAVTGGPLATLAPGVSDTTTFIASYALTQADINAGGVTNQATAAGTPPIGADVTDLSDESGTTPADNDPTVTPIAPAAAVALVKTGTVNPGADGVLNAGDTIEYSYVATNTGNVTLTNFGVAEDTAIFTGTGTDPVPAYLSGGTDEDADGATDDLLPGGTITFSASYTLTQADINAGRVTNQAVATGSPPSGPAINDRSDESGTTPADNDPTVTPIIPAAQVAVIKVAGPLTDTNGDGIVGGVGDVISYSYEVRNTGNVTLTNVSVTDPDGPVLGGPIATLAPGGADTTTFTTTHTITQADLDAGNVTTQSTVTATPPSGPAITDLSDEAGFTPTDNDPTVVPLTPPAAQVAVIKVAGPLVDTNGDGIVGGVGDVISYSYEVRNTGGVTLTNVSVNDPDGPVLGGPIATLAPGGADTTTFTTTHTITQADLDAGNVTTQSTVTATPPSGPAITDLSDEAGFTPTDNDPTVVPLTQGAPQIGAAMAVVSQVANPDGTFDIVYKIIVRNTGNTRLSALRLQDNLNVPGQLGSSFVRIVTAPRVVLINESGTAEEPTANGSYSGNAADPDLLIGTDGELAPGDSYEVTFTVRVNPNADGAPRDLKAQATAFGTSPSGQVVQDLTNVGSDPEDGAGGPGEPTVLRLPVAGLSIAKVASVRLARRGDTIGYTITVTKTGPATDPLSVIDRLPPGFLFVEGSAKVDGVAATPEGSGQQLRFNDITVPANGKVTISIRVQISVSVQPGDHTNLADVLDQTSGESLAPRAKATVRIQIESVFDCGDIIGKVFDDVNRNGYQDEGEKGLPGVRLATVRGVLITTDRHGRFSVPCADIPAKDIGSNFLLKLDTRTLPTGYRVTTENPRVVRLTQGKMTKLNFGAAIDRVVRIDLNDSAFVAGSTEASTELTAGVDKLITTLNGEHSVLRLTYYAFSDDAKIAKRRLDALSKLIKQRWKAAGGSYELGVESKVVRK